MNLRAESPRDFDAIRALHLAAFVPSEFEADIADDLRRADDHVPELCLVALDDTTIAGHVMLSHAHVEEHPVLALGPIGVVPGHQHLGVDSALMHEVIERASRTEYPLIALLGHPTYYPRFGFVRARTLDILPPEHLGAIDKAWMARPAPTWTPTVRGRVTYPSYFAELD